MFGNIFKQNGGRCPARGGKECKKMFKQGMKNFMEQMKVNNQEFEKNKEEKK